MGSLIKEKTLTVYLLLESAGWGSNEIPDGGRSAGTNTSVRGGGLLSLGMGTNCSPRAWELWLSHAKQAEKGGLLMTQNLLMGSLHISISEDMSEDFISNNYYMSFIFISKTIIS